MGLNYLWDTNIVIYYLQQKFTRQSEIFIDSLLLQNKPLLSVISEIELLSWKSTSKHDYDVLLNFIIDSIIFDLDNAVKTKTVQLRRQNKIKIPDAIIAATALVNDFTLITRNISDFKNIEELKFKDIFIS